MEILQNLWNVLVTEDENLTRYLCLPLAFTEVYVIMTFFTTILNIKYDKKQKYTYFIVMSFFSLLCLYILPKSLSLYLNLIILPAIVKLVFKTSLIKSIIAEIISMLSIALLELLYLNLCRMFFNFEPTNCINIPLFRISFVLFMHLTIFLLAKLIKNVKVDFNIFDKINTYNKKLIILNLIFIVISIAAQFYLFIFYNNAFPIYICLISLTSLIIYSIISIYSIFKIINLEMTKKDLEQSQLHNKTLELLYNNICSFKHDLSNILTAFGGYIYTRDIDGIEKYYNKILKECHINNNLSTLNPNIINNPAIYNILATKYYKADELGIDIHLEIFINLNELKFDIYKFSRILAILLDNAIEASCICEEKVINIELRNIKPQHCQILTIENTYSNKDVDISKLSTKGYTSKTSNKESHGIGLWQVSRLVKQHDNIQLNTSKTDKFFKQELIIFY